MDRVAEFDAEKAWLLKQFGNHMRTLRDKDGRSQQEIANDARVHRTEIGDIETGAREPGFLTMMVLAKTLGCSLDALVEGLPVPEERKPSPQARRRANLAGKAKTQAKANS